MCCCSYSYAHLFALADQAVLHGADVRVGDGRRAPHVETLVGEVARLGHAGAQLLLQCARLARRLRVTVHLHVLRTHPSPLTSTAHREVQLLLLLLQCRRRRVARAACHHEWQLLTDVDFNELLTLFCIQLHMHSHLIPSDFTRRRTLYMCI